MVDCSKYHSRDKWELLLKQPIDRTHTFTPQEIEEAVWTHIDQAFSEPVSRSDETPDYVPTQILAELFKSEGYGGIAYKSMFTDDGFNLAFFDPSILTQVQGQLHRTEKIRVDFGDAIDEYFVDEEGSVVRNVIVAVEPVKQDKD